MHAEIIKTSMVCGEISFRALYSVGEVLFSQFTSLLSCTVLPIQFFGKVRNKEGMDY